MAVLDFPNAPTVGQIATLTNGISYQWSGTVWTLAAGANAIAGGDLTGEYPNPVIAPGAVNYAKRGERIHGARVWRNAALAVGSGGNTTVTFDQVDHNEATAGGGVMWSAAAPDRLTVQTTGAYLIAATFGFDPAAGGTRRDVYIDVGFIAGRETRAAANIPLNMTLSVTLLLNPAAVIKLIVYQDSGANLNAVSSFGALPTLTAIRLG